MILAILQARVSSSRFHGKVLRPILGQPMILRQIERIRLSKRIEKLVLATSTHPTDDSLVSLLSDNHILFFRGSLNDVLDRFYQAALIFQPTHVIRLTGDCPLIDPQIIDQVIDTHILQENDYTTNVLPPTYPDGLDVEIVRFEVLKKAWQEARLSSDREHVLTFIANHPEHFRQNHLRNKSDLSHLRWTVDEPCDFEFITRVYEALYPRNIAFTTHDILELLEQKPELKTINNKYKRNEGYQMSLRKNELAKRYRYSEAMLERTLKYIPSGSQTFSKSKTQYPLGVSPYFIKRAMGSHTWDVDGNEYIDFVNGLCSVTLGHCDPDVTKAVQEQLQDGIMFTLSHPLETEVAENICEFVPCAEMVRFGKNGSDATSGSIRLARAYTKRDHVAVCGYHGWQDWYIGATTRNLGVPKATRELTHTWTYNDIDSLFKIFNEHPGQIAAVIMEPMNVYFPKPGFLESVKELTHKNRAILIFDEIVTGFRYSEGGAQKYFGVTPDLAAFGKGMANGYPISAVVGRADIMRLMEEIFFSFTFGGETLSLAASLATMKKLKREPVIKTIYTQGEKLMSGIRDLITKYKLESMLAIEGNPTWSFLIIKDTTKYSSWQLKTLYLQEIFAQGILSLATHNMSYAHSDSDIEFLLATYNKVFPLLKNITDNDNLNQHLLCKPLEPLFKVR